MNRRQITIDTLNKIATEQFRYGRVDCCLVAAKVVHAITGINPAEKYYYHNGKGAYNIVDSHGGLSGLLTSLLGHSDKSGFDYGDPVMINFNDKQMIGVFMATFVYIKTIRGMVQISVDRIIEGWKLCPRQ